MLSCGQMFQPKTEEWSRPYKGSNPLSSAMNKVYILCPHFSEQIYTRGILSIMQQMQFADKLIMPESASKSLAEIRNELVSEGLKTDATHFLFLDSDELFPMDMTPRLLAHDKDIIGAWTVIRQDIKPNVYKMVGQYKHEPYEGKGLEKIDRLGFGSVLIKRSVFEKLKYPWFSFDEHHHTEDLYFCDIARENGYDIWVDFDLRCKHISLAFL